MLRRKNPAAKRGMPASITRREPKRSTRYPMRGPRDRLAAGGGGEDERSRRVANVELLGEGSQEGREAVDVETADEGAEQRAGCDHPQP